MKQVLLKTIVIVVGKSKSKVLQDTGLHRASRGGDGVRKFSPSCRAMQGWSKIKPCRAVVKILSFGPIPPHCHPYVTWHV